VARRRFSSRVALYHRTYVSRPFAGGKRVRTGSDEPRVLKRVIDQARETLRRDRLTAIDSQKDRAA
jgi:hypothetical protein